MVFGSYSLIHEEHQRPAVQCKAVSWAFCCSSGQQIQAVWLLMSVALQRRCFLGSQTTRRHNNGLCLWSGAGFYGLLYCANIRGSFESGSLAKALQWLLLVCH